LPPQPFWNEYIAGEHCYREWRGLYCYGLLRGSELMASQERPRRIVRFGEFETDLDSGELFTNGLKVHLPEQPFQFLAILLACPGELVSRDDLRRRLWPDDTYVDFDRSLNTAASKLRDALGDSAENPRYIQTLPKRGYRLIAPVNEVVAVPLNAAGATDKQLASRWRFRRGLISVAAAVAIVLMFGLAYLNWQSSSSLPHIVRSVQLTNDGFGKSPELASDGPRIYFSAWKGGRGVLAQASAMGGDTELMPAPVFGHTNACLRGISPDGQQLLVATGRQFTREDGFPLWTVRPSGLAGRRLGELVGNDVDWAPDGRRITYATYNQVWTADASGTHRRKVAEIGGMASYPRWSPDGKRIRFTSLAWETAQNTIWEVSADGGVVRPLFPNWSAEQWGGRWTPDGNYYIFNSESNIWAVCEKPLWFRKTALKPIQLTFGHLHYYAPLPAADGRRIFAVGEIRRGELLRYDTKRSEFFPAFPGLSADGIDYSRDGEWIVYVTYPQGDLWRSRLDGSERLQLTSAPMKAFLPRWSPDGREIVFSGRKPGEVWKAYLIGARGGTPEVLAPSNTPQDTRSASWSPDGTRLVLSSPTPPASLVFLDLRTHKPSPVPASDGLAEPIWSPNGRYICATRIVDSAPMLFDVGKQTWNENVAPKECWSQRWTRDSKSFYCVEGKGEAIHRFDVATRRSQKVVSLKDYRMVTANATGVWFGVSHDGSPLILNDVGIQEIYALEWRLP
jgi:Tol biopolymer transport system component/DNA-binding winged helix-turn-helix (wHTH) protein